MRAVIQRCTNAEVKVDGETLGKIEKGFMVLLGVGATDTEWDIQYLARKIAGLRIFEDENEKMNYNIEKVGGEILIISNFTLYGNAYDGFRPSFSDAMMPAKAEDMYNKFVDECKKYPYKSVQTGKFGGDMQIDIHNDGPVTIIIESEKGRKK